MRIRISTAGVKRKVLVGSVVALPILGAGGVAYAATLHGAGAPAPAVTVPATGAARGNDAPGANDTPDTQAVATGGAEAPDTGSSTADGPGGHQDSTGVDVNHQFDGQE